MAQTPGQLNKPNMKCPSCGFDNILGLDRCEQCLHTLMQTGLPQPRKDDKLQQAIMTTPVSELLTGKDLLVCSPEDAFKCFMRTEMDYLVMGCFLLVKKEQKPIENNIRWQEAFELD